VLAKCEALLDTTIACIGFFFGLKAERVSVSLIKLIGHPGFCEEVAGRPGDAISSCAAPVTEGRTGILRGKHGTISIDRVVLAAEAYISAKTEDANPLA